MSVCDGYRFDEVILKSRHVFDLIAIAVIIKWNIHKQLAMYDVSLNERN